jgi:hypothetical protein
MSESVIARRQVIFGLGLAGIGSMVGRARADGPVAGELAMPLGATVGMILGQTARLSVVHHHHGKDIPPICNIVAEIVDAGGKVLASAKFSDLGPNEARFLDFAHPGTRGRLSESRREIFARVSYTPGHHVGATLEIVGVFGQTNLGVPAIGIEDPELAGEKGEPRLAPSVSPGTVGFVRGQLLRVSMLHLVPQNIPPVPCIIVAEVFDAQGKMFATKTFANPGANQALFLDVPHSGGPGAPRRLEAMVNVRHTAGHSIGASLQVVDALTGVTTMIPPSPCITPDSSL